MTYFVNENCIKCKLMDCVEVCPIDCFYEGENMLVIKPDGCIDCGVCEPECPIDAIQSDTIEDSSKWVEMNTKPRERNYDKQTDTYFWSEEDLLNPDVPNSNQVDIPIQANERVEIRVKSISEVGWPNSPVESDWSESIFVDFPIIHWY